MFDIKRGVVLPLKKKLETPAVVREKAAGRKARDLVWECGPAQTTARPGDLDPHLQSAGFGRDGL